MEYMENQMDNQIEGGLIYQQYLQDNLIPGNSIKFGKEYCKANNCIYLTNTVKPIILGSFDNDNGGFSSTEEAPSILNKTNHELDSIFHLFENDLSGFMDCEIIINMRKKLTEDVLHPYLPYGLEIDILNYKQDYVGIMKAPLIGYYYLIDRNKNEQIHYTYLGGSTGKDLSLIKPYLRPLSYIDLEWFQKNINPKISKFIMKHEGNLLLNPPLISYCIIDKRWNEEKWFTFGYNEYQLIFKDKIDVFNLINSGLVNKITTEK